MSDTTVWEVPTLYCSPDDREGCIVEAAAIIANMPRDLTLLMNCGHLFLGRMVEDHAFYFETAHRGFLPLMPGTKVTYREEGLLTATVSYGGAPLPTVSIFSYLRGALDRYTVPSGMSVHPADALRRAPVADIDPTALLAPPPWLKRAFDTGQMSVDHAFCTHDPAGDTVYECLLRAACLDDDGGPYVARLAPGSIIYHTERGLAWTPANHRLTTYNYALGKQDMLTWARVVEAAGAAGAVKVRNGRTVFSGTDIELKPGDHVGHADTGLRAYLPGYVDPPLLQWEVSSSDFTERADHLPQWVREAACVLQGVILQGGEVLCQHRNTVALSDAPAPKEAEPVELADTPVTGTVSVDGRLNLSLSAKALIGLMQQAGGVAIRQSIVQEVMSRYVKGFMPEHVDNMVAASLKTACDNLMAEGRSILRTVYNGFEASFTLTPGATPASAPEYVRLTDRGTQQVRLAVEKRLDEVMTEHVQKLVDEHIRSAATEGTIRNMVAAVIADSFDSEVKAAIRARMSAAIQSALDDMPNIQLRVADEHEDK